MNRIVVLFFVFIFQLTTLSTAQQLNYIHQEFEMESQILNESRTGTIYLPSNKPADLPVLYVLDGEWNHELVSGIVGYFIRWNRIPNMAVVSLNTMINRTRDFSPTEDDTRYPGSGGGEEFLSFIEKEFIPFIEEEYNLSDQRILFGHSFGGLFSLYTLKMKPELFSGYISVSPSVWWKDDYMYGKYNFSRMSDSPFVYVTAGTNDRTNTPAVTRYVDFLNNEGLAKRVELYSDIHEGEDHFTNVSITLHEGLKKLFPVNRFEHESILAWNEGGKEAIQSWYEHSFSEYGYRFRLPEESIRTYAYNLHAGEGKTKKSIELLQWLASVHDKNYQVFYFLAAVAAEDGQNELAIKNYRKALEVGNMPPRMRIVIERNIAEIEG